MKIVNRTEYDTRHLKAIISRVAAAELDAAQRKATTFVIDYRKGRSEWPTGRWLDGSRVKVFLPRKITSAAFKPALGVILAYLMLAWIRKTSFPDWRKAPRYSFSGNWREFYEHLNAYPLEVRAPVVKKISPALRVTTRLRHALDQVKKWESKRKLAETKIKVWNATVKYHQRRAKAMTAPVDPAKPKPVRKPKPALDEALRQARQSLLQKHHEDPS